MKCGSIRGCIRRKRVERRIDDTLPRGISLLVNDGQHACENRRIKARSTSRRQVLIVGITKPIRAASVDSRALRIAGAKQIGSMMADASSDISGTSR